MSPFTEKDVMAVSTSEERSSSMAARSCLRTEDFKLAFAIVFLSAFFNAFLTSLFTFKCWYKAVKSGLSASEALSSASLGFLVAGFSLSLSLGSGVASSLDLFLEDSALGSSWALGFSSCFFAGEGAADYATTKHGSESSPFDVYANKPRGIECKRSMRAH